MAEAVAHSVKQLVSRGGGAMDKIVRPESGRLSVRIPAPTYLGR